ncbi:hypothetical protein OG225_37745 [Nocardia sp. NBC_01377]|uniref:hypothetical protein n=1 Tax=Nocardia sp. NBC_01377 TaxID=2903595 RepID=UPI003254E0AF
MSIASMGSEWRARSRNRGSRAGALSGAARRELLLRGTEGVATVLGVRRGSTVAGFELPGAADGEGGHVFLVRVVVDGVAPYETRVRQRMRAEDLKWAQAGDVVRCRVDPGDRDRLVLYLPEIGKVRRVSVAKTLADGRRADATVLAAAPVAADYSGIDDPVLRLDLELRAWDEPTPWRVRLIQPVPLAAIGLVDLGQHLEVAFFTVDRGESVAVDWTASLGER